MLLTVAACGVGPLPIDGSDADRPPDAIAPPDGPSPNVTARVPPGADVVVSRADGTFHAHVVADVTGVALLAVDPGDLVSLVQPGFGVTVADVQPGDQLAIGTSIPWLPELDEPAVATVTGAIRATLSGTAPSGAYFIGTSCDRRAGEGELGVCQASGTIDVLAILDQTTDVDGAERVDTTHYALARGIAIGGAVSLGAWRPVDGFTLTAVDYGPDDRVGFTASIRALVDGAGVGFRLRSARAASLGPGGSDAVTVPRIAGLGDGHLLDVAAWSADARFWFSRRVERRAGPAPAAGELSIAADVLAPPDGAALDLTDADRPVATWSREASTGTAVVVELALRDGPVGPRRFGWHAYLPPGTARFQVPVMPAELASARPPPGQVADHLDLTVIDATEVSWSTFRARQWPALVAPGAVGGVARVAQRPTAF